MNGCEYCRRQRAFWAWDADGSAKLQGKKQMAHIIAGTNTFSDTAGLRMNFVFCPMCGESLVNPPDDRSGLVSVISAIFPSKRNSTLRKGVCINHGEQA